ncbi:MAG: carboxypeptidase-like regulatory domain-containing protein, partial [Terracidiphilus sp.]
MKSTPIDANCFKSMNFQARTKLYKALLFVVVCVLAIMIAPSARGQATGSFSGNLADKSGGAIPSATVTVTAQETGQVRTTKTDSTGHYLVPLLPVGLFTVKVDAAGFNSAETKDLRLQVDEARELDFTLVPKTVVETVAVEADAVAVETANPSLGQVITSQEVSQLPLNGRDFVQLATLTAGATAETNPGSFFNGATDSEVSARGSFSLSVGGSRPNSTDWLLDGVDNNELTAGGIGVFSSIDDIAEFKVLTYTYSAEFGTRAGPTVLVTTKSGTNNFHGSLYEFVRNTDLDARSDFATSTPKFNLNQFGGSVGGPILRNKAFFFVDGEQKYQREGIVYPGLVPTQEMINGDFTNDPWGNAATTSISNPYAGGESFQCVGSSTGTPIPAGPNGSQAPGVACNKIPSNLISSIGQGLMKLYPAVDPSNPKELPVGDYNQGYNYVTEPVRSLNETKFDARLDETFGAKDNAFARFSYDQAFTYAPGGAPPPSLAEGNPFGSNETLINHARNIGIGESHVFSPNMLNQASVGYDRIFDYIASQDNFSCESTLLGIPNADLGCSASGAPLPGGAYSQGLVSVEVYGGYWSLGDRGYSPFQGG